MEMLFMLLCGHALADFALQPDAMAKGKNRQWNRKPEHIPLGKKYVPWPYWLLSHGFIAGGVVYCITQNVWLGIAETVLHCGIDFMKCEDLTDLHTDQFLHFMCRVCYLAWL